MSEKLQHTALRTQLLMQDRYGVDLHHKHDKCHFTYRAHQPSHPKVQANGNDLETNKNSPTGQIHQIKLRKIRKRLAKGSYH